MRARDRYLIIGVVAMALWPVWRWSLRRYADGSGDAWELIALVTALALLYRDRDLHHADMEAVTLPATILFFYAALYSYMSPLERGVVGMLAIGTAISRVWYGERVASSICGLFVISLPVMSSLNFYAGYPLRIVVGEAAAALLQLNGLDVVRDGAQLLWAGRAVAIDAPCSGIKMLWTGAYLCFATARLLRLSNMRTIALLCATCAIVLFANVLRAASLFYVETNLIAAPDAAHDATGIVSFVLAACAIMGTSSILRVNRASE